jgi:serralysin
VNDVRACVEVKPKVDPEAIRAAVEETEENDPLYAEHTYLGTTRDQRREALALITGKKWQNGRTIKVFFESTASGVVERVKPYFLRWTEVANIGFEWVTDRMQSDIRVGFRSGDGSWSYLGTDCLTVRKSSITINFGWLTPDEDEQEYQRVVLHEVGHALGAIHEHQNPSGGIPWDKPAVYKYYGGPPNYWDKATIDHNIFERYSEGQTNFTDFDRLSIMAYPIDNSLTIGDFFVPFNLNLSQQDRAFMAWCYPKPQEPPPPPPPPTEDELPEISINRFVDRGVRERSLVIKNRRPWAIAEPPS